MVSLPILLKYMAECLSAAAQKKTLIVPDKDADGLDAGAIVYKTLVLLGLSPSCIDNHLLQKHRTVHDDEERKAMSAKEPSFVIVLDQGSRRAPAVVESKVKTLIIDHHLSDEFPEDTIV